MEMTYSQAMATAQGFLYRAALANAFGDFANRDALTAKAAEMEEYAATQIQEY